MDTSETYIKMCKQAEEIQKQKPKGGLQDYFYCYTHGFGCDVDTSIWLPRQDQLQAMVDWNCFQLSARFAEFAHKRAGYISGSIPSMEQLWLAFVMSELYHKKWTGEKWEVTP